MTPKEKAIELIEKYKEIESFYIHKRIIIMPLPEAKQCALIAVDEILDLLEDMPQVEFFYINFYKEVKQEIKNL